MVKKVFEVIENAGGSLKLAYELKLHQYTVERWKKHGIPIRYWEHLEKKYGYEPGEIQMINRKLREQKF